MVSMMASYDSSILVKHRPNVFLFVRPGGKESVLGRSNRRHSDILFLEEAAPDKV